MKSLKKILGVFSAVFLIGAGMFNFVSCSSNDDDDDAKPVNKDKSDPGSGGGLFCLLPDFQ